MRSGWKRVLSLVLTMCMSISLVSANVWAAESSVNGSGSTKSIEEMNEEDEVVFDEESTPKAENAAEEEEGKTVPEDVKPAKLEAQGIVASGECGAQGDNVIWTLDDEGTLTISGKGAMADYSRITTNLKYGSSWITGEKSFNRLIIKKGVTTIGNYAFIDNINLTSVSISDSVKSIGEGAFYFCEKLKNITIPQKTTSIGSEAFCGCSSLESINIPSGVTTLNKSVFHLCTSLTSITIPESVTSIGNDAFYYCTSLNNVTIPSSVKSIEQEAFCGCKKLSRIDIPNSVYYIGADAFSDCTGLDSVTIPGTVTSLGERAFGYCWGMTGYTSKIADFIIRGYSGSVAEQYATKNNFAFQSIGVKEDKEETLSVEIPELNSLKLRFNDTTDISFDWGTNLLKGDAGDKNGFNLNLAKAAIYLCEGTYTGKYETENRMRNLGLTNPQSEYYTIDNQTNTSPITIASNIAKINNEDYLIIGVAVRGTFYDGWDIITDLRSGLLNIDGFSEAGETGIEVVKEYYYKVKEQTGIDKKHTILFVTGHSLGAAVAGQIAGNLQGKIAYKSHIFAYTFASPFYETHGKDVKSYTNIYNIVNTVDAVPQFPLGGLRYGVDKTFKGDGTNTLDQHMLGTYLRSLEKPNPPKTNITSLKSGKKSISVSWKPKSDVTGYQIQYSLKNNFQNGKTATIKSSSKKTEKVSGLKTKATYYARVRTYQTVFGNKYYSPWSTKKSIKTK